VAALDFRRPAHRPRPGGRGRDEALVRRIVPWRVYTRLRGLELDLVILDERAGEAAGRLRGELETGAAGAMLGKPDGVFFLTGDSVAADDAVLIAAAARAVLGAGRGPLEEQIDRGAGPPPARPPRLAPPRAAATAAAKTIATPTLSPGDLLFWNGFGDSPAMAASTSSGSRAPERARPGCRRPLDERSRQPGVRMSDDRGRPGLQLGGQQSDEPPHSMVERPRSDPPGEAVYVRDEETGDFWTPTPLPRGPRATVTVTHGQGYTRYAHDDRGLHQELLVFVPLDDPLKLLRLRLRNDGDRPRRLSVTYYAEWVLGTVRENAPLQVVCERDAESGAVLARNAWAGAFAEKTAFAASGPPAGSVTADRAEFLGEHGSVFDPAALGRVGLSGRAGPGSTHAQR
jgi:hypothetical protein